MRQSIPWDRISRFIVAIGEAPSHPDFTRRISTQIHDLVDCDDRVLLVAEDTHGRLCPLPASGFFQDCTAIFNQRFLDDLPAPPGTGGTCVAWRRFQGTRFYDEFLAPMDIGFSLCVFSSCDSSTRFIIHRPRSGKPFNDREVEICRTIAPHLRNLNGLYQRIQGAAQNENRPLSMEGVSPRERQVLNLLLRGYTAAMIGEVLFISERTVQKHLERAYDKLGARKKSDIIRLLNTTNP